MHRVVLAVCLVVFPLADSALARTPARVCRQACSAAITRCIEDGGRPRACRRSVVRRCKRFGTTACSVTPSSTTLPTQTTVTTTSSTTTTRPQGLAGLFGTWDFTYTIVSTYEDRYVMSSVQTSDTGVPFILARDVYEGVSDAIVARPADLGFTSFPYEFALLDAGSFLCDFFVFDKTGANAVSGLYYGTYIDFDGTCGDLINPSTPYSMAGVRTAAPVLAAGVSEGSAEPRLDALVRMLDSVGK
jgi:hypothetical protein